MPQGKADKTTTPYIVVTGQYLGMIEAREMASDIETMIKEKYGENVQATVHQEEWDKIAPQSPNRLAEPAHR